MWSDYFCHHLSRVRLCNGERLEFLHVCDVWVSVRELIFHDFSHYLPCSYSTLSASTVPELEMVVEDVPCRSERWPLYRYLFNLLYDCSHGGGPSRKLDDLFTLYVLVYTMFFNDVRLNCMGSWLYLSRNGLLKD